MPVSWREFLYNTSHQVHQMAHDFSGIAKNHMQSNGSPTEPAKRKLSEHIEIMKNAINAMQRAGVDAGSPSRSPDDRKTQELARSLAEQKIEMIEKDKKYEELQSRLSKEMSAKLRTNNPNVLELSDPMNSSKVAVMLMGVYDEEWTKAFDVLRDHNREEYDTVMKLKSELMKCFEFCRTHADSQLKDICRAMLGDDCDRPEDQLSPELKKSRQLVMANRKTLAVCSLRYLSEEYQPQAQLKEELETYNPSERSLLLDYIVKCIETCWYMAISDPPLFLLDQPQGGQPLDPRMFQPFQTRGSYIHYVVWPALVLDNNGGVVSKGVAEFSKDKPKTQYPNVQKM